MIRLCFIYKQTLRAAFSGEIVAVAIYKQLPCYMKATGLVRLQPHLDEEVLALPVGDVQKEPSDSVSQVKIKAELFFKGFGNLMIQDQESAPTALARRTRPC